MSKLVSTTYGDVVIHEFKTPAQLKRLREMHGQDREPKKQMLKTVFMWVKQGHLALGPYLWLVSEINKMEVS
jgi:hypothetical protein